MVAPVDLVLVDTFTERAFAGNTVGVVQDGARLSSGQMQILAAEIRALTNLGGTSDTTTAAIAANRASAELALPRSLALPRRAGRRVMRG